MNEPQSLIQFLQQQYPKILEQALVHIGLTFMSLLLAILIGVPLGIYITRNRALSSYVLGFAGILQTIPSIALLGFMIPLLGIGPVPAIAALFLYALLPIIRNTYTGINEVNPAVKDAAVAMGMKDFEVLRKIEIPLAMPVLIAGIRTATVINVGVATLAAYIAAGGLGEFIFGGIALNNSNMILAGAIPAALLAIFFDFLLSRVQKISLHKMKAAWLMLPVAVTVLSSFFFFPMFSGKNMLAGFTPEFMGRQDGYLGLRDTYKMNIRTVVISDAVMYKAVAEKKLDIISGSSTDGRGYAYDLLVLDDDKNIFPPYYAAPIVRQQTLDKYPELQPALEILAGTINDSIMTALNYRVDVLKHSPRDVAIDFLKSKGLFKSSRNGKKGVIRIGSKLFGDGYILVAMYEILIEGNTELKVESKTGLGGTQICFEALTNNQIDLYPEYSGTGLLVILKANKNIVDSLIGNKNKVYDFVQKQFQTKYNIRWLTPIGFNNTYALMMRRSQARELKISSITDLGNYLNTNMKE